MFWSVLNCFDVIRPRHEMSWIETRWRNEWVRCDMVWNDL